MLKKTKEREQGLLKKILQDPNSQIAQEAREELEFSKHTTLKRYNLWLLILTLTLALSSLGECGLEIWKEVRTADGPMLEGVLDRSSEQSQGPCKADRL